MLYSGDIKNLILSIIKADGTSPTVTVEPTVIVIQLATGDVALAAVSMNLLAGTQAVYTYAWSTGSVDNGDYVAIVSYASDGITVNGRLLEAFHIGDSNITGPVALSATVALNATVAKDATVAHVTDLAAISPDSSAMVLAIKAQTDNLPANPADQATLTDVASEVQDLHDYQLGTWTIDKSQNPQILTILSPSQTVVARFALSDDPSFTQRVPQ